MSRIAVFALLFSLQVILQCCKTAAPVITHVESAEVQIAERPSAPGWVLQKPVSDMYYTGVGYAPVSNADYLNVARNRALEDLSSEISVHISSRSVLLQIENTAGFNEQYLSSISAKTDRQLENYEHVGSWNDGKNYWTCYQLSKKEYSRLKQTRKDAAMRLAVENYEHAYESCQLGNTNGAIRSFLNVLVSLKDYLNEDNIAVFKGNPVYLASSAWFELQNIFDSLHISGASELKIKTLRSTQSITYNVATNGPSGIIPAGNIQVICSGSGKVIKTQSDHNGKVSFLSGELSGLGNQVYLVPDLNSYTEGLPDIIKAITQKLNVNKSIVQIQYTPSLVLLVTEEKNLGINLLHKELQNIFMKLMQDHNLFFTKSNQDADLFIQLKADTRRGSEYSGLYTSYLDISVSVKDRSGSEIFNDRISNIKGIKLSYEEAGLAAYRSAESVLKESLVENLIESIKK